MSCEYFSHTTTCCLLQVTGYTDDGDDSEFSADEWVKPEEYYQQARRTFSVGRFNKVAYPDLHGSKPIPKKEPLYERKFGVQRYAQLCHHLSLVLLW